MSEFLDNHGASSSAPVSNPSTGATAPAATSAIGLSMPDFLAIQQQNNEWSAYQAQLNRDWQERMSSSAHQREVQDLIKAGLNPVLSAGGQGASTPSGATAATDTSASGAIASVLNAMLSANSAQAVADKYNAMSKYVAELNDLRQKEYPTSMWGAISSATNAALGRTGLHGSITSPIWNVVNVPSGRKLMSAVSTWYNNFLARYGKGQKIRLGR